MRKYFLMICLTMSMVLCACGAAEEGKTPLETGKDPVNVGENSGDSSEPQRADHAFVVRITINPEVVLYLDESGKVVDAEQVNEDAKALCALEDLLGKSYEGALKLVVSEAVKQGFAKDAATVDVQVDAVEAGSDGGFVLEETKAVVKEVSRSENLELFATTNKVDIDIWQQYEPQGAENMPEFCGNCRGTGICKNCKGTKELLCGECLGEKIAGCPECNGQGEFSGECPNCHGEGRQECPRCHGTQQVECPRCHGTLEQNCDWCQGDGKNHVTTTHDGHHLNPDEYDPVCKKCKGSGRKHCTDCDHGHVKCRNDKGVPCDNGKVTCETCGGAGHMEHMTCLRCEGAKRIPCPACEQKGYTECPYCSGSGECADCNGTGCR